MGNTPGDWQIQLPPPPQLPWLGFRFTLPGPARQHLLGRGERWSPDEEVHISARYGQLIAHLIKKRVIKIGWANG